MHSRPLACVLLVVFACDRRSDPPPAVVVPTAAGTSPTVAVAEVLTLRPDTRTILRPVDDNGVLVGQPGDEGKSSPAPLRLIRADGDVRHAPFDAEAIAARLGVPADQVIVRDALPVDGGQCLVFVNGYAGPKPLAGLWLYRFGRQTLTLVADAKRLGQVSGLGDSAAVADGRLIDGGREAWLWLSSYGQTAVVRCSTRVTDTATPELRLADQRLTDTNGRPLALGNASVWAAGDGRALWVRPGQHERYRINLSDFSAVPESGGLPSLSCVMRGERVRWDFAERINRPLTEAEAVAPDERRYPLLTLTPDAGPPVTVDRNGLKTRIGFPTHALRLTQWCAEPATGRVLAYDAMSGEVLRLSRD